MTAYNQIYDDGSSINRPTEREALRRVGRWERLSNSLQWRAKRFGRIQLTPKEAEAVRLGRQWATIPAGRRAESEQAYISRRMNCNQQMTSRRLRKAELILHIMDIYPGWVVECNPNDIIELGHAIKQTKVA